MGLPPSFGEAPPHRTTAPPLGDCEFQRALYASLCHVVLQCAVAALHLLLAHEWAKLSFGCRCAARFCATSSDATSQSRVQHDKFTTASRHHNALCLVLNRHTPHLYAQIQHQAFTFLHFPRLPRPRGPADPRSQAKQSQNCYRTRTFKELLTVLERVPEGKLASLFRDSSPWWASKGHARVKTCGNRKPIIPHCEAPQEYPVDSVAGVRQ